MIDLVNQLRTNSDRRIAIRTEQGKFGNWMASKYIAEYKAEALQRSSVLCRSMGNSLISRAYFERHRKDQKLVALLTEVRTTTRGSTTNQ